ncbi:VOC family protein [Quadrisphaera oryzae]|uniref:VOC family protein n=1 Tax=Quadrisphaera TaxID=317661 RepID=UPI001C96183C
MDDDDTRPRLRVTSVTLAASDAQRLAAFYSRLLGSPVTADEPGWAQVRPASPDLGPVLSFEHDARFTRPTWPSEPSAQHATAHLDVHVDDLDAAVTWALEVGAVLDPFQPQDDVRVLRDPDGHPFCLFT